MKPGYTPGVGNLSDVMRNDPIEVAPYMLISARGRRLSPLAQPCRDMVAAMLDEASQAKPS